MVLICKNAVLFNSECTGLSTGSKIGSYDSCMSFCCMFFSAFSTLCCDLIM